MGLFVLLWRHHTCEVFGLTVFNMDIWIKICPWGIGLVGFGDFMQINCDS